MRSLPYLGGRISTWPSFSRCIAVTDGGRRALFVYNHADWYVNDVLCDAAADGGGMVAADHEFGPNRVGHVTIVFDPAAT